MTDTNLYQPYVFLVMLVLLLRYFCGTLSGLLDRLPEEEERQLFDNFLTTL
jgi:hypothetical protein